jgi:hypothetical protein
MKRKEKSNASRKSSRKDLLSPSGPARDGQGESGENRPKSLGGSIGDRPSTEGKTQEEAREEEGPRREDGVQGAEEGLSDGGPDGEDAKEDAQKDDEGRVLRQKLTNREVILAALTDGSSRAFLVAQEFILETTRQTRKKPATVTFQCPDSWVTNVEGGLMQPDFFYAIRVPRDFVEMIEKEPN